LKLQARNILFNIADWFRREIFVKRLSSPLGLAVLLFMALVSGFLAAKDLFIIPFALGGALIGITVVVFCLFKPYIAYYLITILAFFIFFPSHLIGYDIKVAMALEILILFLFFGTMISKKANPLAKNDLIKTPIAILFMLNVIMFLLEAFNSNVPNLAGWYTPTRRLLVYVLVFILSYRLFDSFAKVKQFINAWIILSFVCALYGCYQQWFGYLPSEIRYIMSRPGEFELMFQGGQFRKFSFLSDVVTFGILCGSMSVLTLLLGINEKNKRWRYFLFFATLILLLGMAYSGTRTTNIMLPSGMALYGFVTIQKKRTLLALFGMVMLAMFILFAPIYNNPTLNRMRTTFDSKESSLNVRDINRKYIQPYIHAHAFGGGISTSGVEGLSFYPGHPLAGFPPDSGLLKAALELGWIGLGLLILFNLVILYQGIYYYFRMQVAEYKKYVVVILCSLFPMMVALYSQNAIGQIPTALFFYSVISIIKRLKEFDDEYILNSHERNKSTN